jgi:hypothetical protein
MAGLGRELVANGWRQGSLLPALPSLFHFHIDRPLTEAAQQAESQARVEYDRRVEAGEEPRPVGQAIAALNDGEVLCVVSQICDIVADEEVEPFVEVMPAYREPDGQKRSDADRNSARRFLLCPGRELIVDATRRFTVEKAVLTSYSPDNPPLSEIREGRLRRFLARRGGRPPLDDDVVRHVVVPIQKVLSKHKKYRRALEPVRSLRIDHLEGPPPYTVRLTVLLGRDVDSEEEGLLDDLVGAIDGWLRDGPAHLEEWCALLEDDIALGAYRATDEIYLDPYTYRGEDVVGVEPGWDD